MALELSIREGPAAAQATADLARRAKPRCGSTAVVAIDGPSGSGKTTLGDAVSGILGAQVIHMDDLFPGWDGLASAVDLLVDQVLDPLALGRPSTYRVWDWESDRWGRPIDVALAPLLVIEGCGSSVGRAGALAAVRVWVEASHAVRFARGINRDGQSYLPHWQRWAEQEQALFTRDQTRERAHVIVDTDLVGSPR